MMGAKTMIRPLAAMFLLAAAAWPSAAAPSVARVADKATIQIGRDAAGRSCQARRVFGDALLATRSDRAYDLTCGRTGGAGRVYILSGGEAVFERWQAASARLCANGRAQDWSLPSMERLQSLYCAGEAAGSAGRPGRAAMVSLAGRVGGALFAGDAALAAAPALERALAILAGLEAEPAAEAPAGPRSALLESLEAALGQELSGGGFADFLTLRRAAFENNALWLFSAAELQFSDAIRMHASLWPEDFAGRADLQSERGLNLSNQRRFAEAERSLQEAAISAARSGDRFMIAKVRAYEALAALNAQDEARLIEVGADAQRLLADWLASPRETSEPIDEASGLLPQPVRAVMLDAQISRARALAFQKSGQSARAREEFARASASAARLDSRAAGWLQAGVAQESAALEAQQGRVTEALQILSAALAAYRKTAVRTRVEANLLMDLADVERQLGRNSEAFGHFDEAFAIYREQPENRGVSVARGLPYLEALAGRHESQGGDETAALLFDAFETLASPAVAQTAAATAARLMAGENGEIIRAFQDGDRRLRRALTRLSSLPVDTLADERQAAEADVARERDAVLQLQAAVDRAFPNYGVVTLAPVTLRELQSSLGPRETVVRLALGLEEGVGLLITRDDMKSFAIPIGERAATELVNRVKGSVRNPDMDFDAAAGRDLFAALFGAVRSDLLSADGDRRLIIEATGALASLPFGVLLTDGTETGWLAARRSLLSVASMKAFVANRAAGPSRGASPFAGFGDFLPISMGQTAGAGAPESLARAIVAARALPESCIPRLQGVLDRLPRLSGTAEEIARVSALTGAAADAVYLRERFTDRAVLDSASVRSARVVMFSTHGVFAADYPDARDCLPEAALLTSAAPGADSLFLDSARVLELKLDADLIVLSACDTGNPEPIAQGETGLPSGGDALSGLARSFFYAGARSVLVSHWVLPDEDTVLLVEDLFRGMRAGLASPEALREAQLAQIGRGASDPLQWAAFALVGAPPAL
jgi:CHAT domain-containing protein